MAIKIKPPNGFLDMEGDAEDHPTPPNSPWHEIVVEGVGPVLARKPMPNAIPALARAADSDMPPEKRLAHHVRFVRNHVAPGEADRLLVGMMKKKFPHDSYSLVSEAIATWGTGRPT